MLENEFVLPSKLFHRYFKLMDNLKLIVAKTCLFFVKNYANFMFHHVSYLYVELQVKVPNGF